MRAIFRSRPYAVPHTRVTCVVIDIVESRYTPRSRMLAVVLTSLPHSRFEEMVVSYDSVRRTVWLQSSTRLKVSLITLTNRPYSVNNML